MTLPKNDKIEEAWGFMKERLSNPLIYSYIVSWIFVNWRVTVGLLWVDSETIINNGYKSYIDFIAFNTTFCKTIIWPLGMAILYTVALPPIRYCITIWNSINFKWGNKRNLKEMGEGAISVDKYLTLRDALDKRKLQFEQMVAQEVDVANRLSQIENEKNDMQLKMNEKENEIVKLNGEIRDLQENFDGAKSKLSLSSKKKDEIEEELMKKKKELESAKASAFKTEQKYLETTDVISKLNGEWVLPRLQGKWHNSHEYNDKSNVLRSNESVIIKGRDYYSITPNNKEELVAHIGFISFNPMTNKLVFVKELVSKYAYMKPGSFPNRGVCLINELTVNEDWTLMEGTEDGNIKISYLNSVYKDLGKQ